MQITKRLSRTFFEAMSSMGTGLPHSYHEEELMIAGVKPAMIISSDDVGDSLRSHLKNGNIVLIGAYMFGEEGTQKEIHVYARADKIEEGCELYSRLYGDEEAYPELSDRQHDHRIGELLGYTKRDTAFFCGEGIYRFSLARRLNLALLGDIITYSRYRAAMLRSEESQTLNQDGFA